MRRRTLLWALGAGAAGLAGCSGSPDTEPAASTPSAPSTTAGASTTPTTTSGDATGGNDAEPAAESTEGDGLRLLSVEPPGRAQIGETLEYAFTVENHAEEARAVDPTVSVRSAATDWTLHQRWEPVELPPGGRHTFESSPFTSEYLDTLTFRVDGFGPTFSAAFTERRLRFDAEFRDPLGRELAVADLDVQTTYEYESGGYRRIVELDRGEQFVFVTVDVVNRTDEALDAPARAAFSLLDGERSYHPIWMPGEGDYEPAEIPWGARTGGRVAYKTPESLSSGQFRVGWRESFDDGDVGVVWTPE